MNLDARIFCGFPRYLIAGFIAILLLPICFAQTTISTGSIQGTITDQSGAALPGAKVTIRNTGNGQTETSRTTSSGIYTSGALTPGNYSVRVEAAGFKTLESTVAVQVGVTSSGNFRLQVGQESQVVQVQAEEVQVDTEQASVQGVLTQQQIENLPINGRNFLDLAQLEPGVQIQDGGNFDPTKKGFSSISLGGRFGRTARIEVDGLDISDETVGTTTQDIPASAIQEFQIGESMLDLSTELTSSGAVNVATRSGTNSFHGEGFYNFRDRMFDANLPGASNTYFQRNQFGGNFGGALIKDRLFFFLDGERTKQGFIQPVLAGPPFQNDTGGFAAPFKEGEVLGRVDWQIHGTAKLFYRFTYDQNNDVAADVPSSFQPMDNITHTRDHALGLDFTTGSYTHSIRVGYMKFFNRIVTGITSTTPFNPSSPIELSIGSDPLCIGNAPIAFCSGQPFLAPQATPQSNHQFKYDGSRVITNHVIRYGVAYNHIQGGGFAGFLADGPAVNASTADCGAGCVGRPGGAANALNYPAQFVLLGNGQGFSTTESAFGFPGGGLGPDNRISWYIGDAWKVKPYLTINYGLRYVRDTGRTDSNLPPVAALNQFNNQFYSNLGARVNQPNFDFAPQFGIAWDPSHRGKTVFRGGIGLFYENTIWNNVLFDQPARLTQGRFLATQPACVGGSPQTFTLPNTTTTITPTFCGQPIGTVQAQIAALQAQYQAAAAAGSGPSQNPSFIGTALADTGPNGSGTNLFAPNFRTPRSVQMNLGIQQEIGKGTVLSVDFIRNVSTHTLLAVDTNHVGDASYFNLANAQAAVNTTNSQFNCGPGTGGVPCAIAAGATISSYAANGLDSGYTFGGGPCPKCAFPGINPKVGANQMLFPIGRSVYNGLQMSLRQHIQNPFTDIRALNLQVSYALSKYVAQAQDTDFINSAWDYNDPSRFIGPNGLDRRHQISFGGTADLPAHFRIGLIGHFYSSLPTTLTLAPTGSAGGIFVTDVYGHGTGDGNPTNGSNGGFGSILPGTNLGSFGRSVTPNNINTYINNYNNNFAGKPTPAGQVLINSGLFSLSQLQALGAVMPIVSPAPIGEAGNGWLRSMDLNLAWIYKVKERVELQPGVSFFNVTNFANFDAPKNTIGGVLSLLGQPVIDGTANGTPGQQPNNLRSGLGSGVFGLGSPRVTEFTLKIAF
jgi:Carboxypeptidase regulatory-like domain